MDRDPETAFALYQVLDFAEARYSLGRCYELGIATAPDAVQAFRAYDKTAQQGFPAAQYALGRYYENGIGVRQDIERARKWYKKAGKGGSAEGEEAYKRLCALR